MLMNLKWLKVLRFSGISRCSFFSNSKCSNSAPITSLIPYIEKLWKRCRYFMMAIIFVGFFMVLSSCLSTPQWSNAVKRGDIKAARSIILETKDISSRNTYGETPLLWAAKIGDQSLVSRLMSLGANVNEANTITGETPLIVASRHGHAGLVNLFINRGASRDATDRSGADAVQAAISSAKFEVLQTLFKKGFNIEESRLGPLLISAANSGEIRIVENLLQAGASPSYQSQDGETVLMAAVKSGKLDLIGSLLKHGAKADAKDSAGRTPLILAAQKGRWDLCEILIIAGCPVDVADARGNTPLMWAILMGHIEVSQRLIQKDADVHRKNAANKNALYIAAFLPETTRILLQRDARIVEITVEDGNHHKPALAYHWLAGFLEKEMAEGRCDPRRTAVDAKLAYDIAGRFFEEAGNKYADMASKLRQQQNIEILKAVLLTAASFAVALGQAHQAAQQMAEISALKSAASGGSGRAVAYGWGTAYVATPNTASLAKAEKECDELTMKARDRAKLCKKQVECYNSAGTGKESLCFQK
jgi:ankyrin repeat protein